MFFRRATHRFQPAFGNADKVRCFDTQFPQHGLSDVELTFAAIYHDQIG